MLFAWIARILRRHWINAGSALRRPSIEPSPHLANPDKKTDRELGLSGNPLLQKTGHLWMRPQSAPASKNMIVENFSIKDTKEY
jgi:hypothetical protein